MAKFTFWGVIASPYQLKMQALADYAEHPWERWPDQSPWLAGILLKWRLQKAQRRGEIKRYPELVMGMDEYPLVPFYTEDGREFYYDSTGFALHLDQHPERHEAALLPKDPGIHFICRLIDEAFDEFGLYMVHHNRWVTSAHTNCMGKVTGEELGRAFPPMKPIIARHMPPRQVRRCPYLFSVAPEGFDISMETALTPPSREGFPPTHALLDEAWRLYLAAMEQLLHHQPYLLGKRFTLADASAYGQLSMNLIDGRAADLIKELAPRTWQWLCDIRDGKHRGSRGELYLSDALQPLLDIINETFVPLMQQNERAYVDAVAAGETLFNEKAFDKGRALYNGELMGHPFRSVAKSFQVVVWRDLCDLWEQLPDNSQADLGALYPYLPQHIKRLD